MIKQRAHRIAEASLLSGTKESFIFPDTHAANFQLATACLRQILYHTPAQPLAGAFNQRISAKRLTSDFRFTDYAAVNWMGHLGRSIACIARARDWSVALNKCFSTFATTLTAFLRNPSAASVWLESFYTDEHYRKESIRQHPPSHILGHFVTWLGELPLEQERGSVRDHLMMTVRDFKKDLERIMSAWGSSLEQSPEIIWDEMTGFVQSTFFFNPSSTKVSVQSVQGPSSRSISRNCLAVVSQTSNKGDIKGVLSIWSPA